jgi:hypothetical protein
MYTLKAIVNRGWYPTLITLLAVLGVLYRWPVEWVTPALIFILAIGLVVTAIKARERQVERAVFKLRQLAEYFTRRFMGDSSLSIFAIIDSVFNIDNPKLWDWARACDMSQRIFNSWCGSFNNRMESDFGVTKLADYLSTYLNEMWQITSHYYEFVEQFSEIAAKVEVPPEALEQYHKFVMEYNAFVQDFREHITELKGVARTGIEPPSVRMAQDVVKMG